MTAKRPCLVIGASGSIGEAIARRMIQQGRRVALTHSPRGRAVTGIESKPGAVHWYSLDVRSAAQTTALVAEVHSAFTSVPDLIYCAGITGDSAIQRVTDALWDDVIATNLSGAFYAIRALASGLSAAGDGRILLIGSVAASKGVAGQISSVDVPRGSGN